MELRRASTYHVRRPCPHELRRRRSSLGAVAGMEPPRFPIQQAIECSLLSFALVASEASETHRQRADDALTSYLRHVLEAFRAQMEGGVPELGIPPLDPLHLGDLRLEEDQALARLNATFRRVQVAGVSAFRIVRLNVYLQRLELALALSFPRLRVTGRYDLHGKAAGILPLSGKGNFWVEASELQASGWAALTAPDGETIQIDNLVLDVEVADIELQFDNLLGGGAIGSAVNSLASALSTDILDRVKPWLVASLQDSLRAKLNHELRNVDIAMFIPGGLAHAVGGRGRRQVTDANEYLDHVLDNAREQIRQGGLDPLTLPDSDMLTDGQLLGLATVYRAGDAALSFLDDGATLEARIGFSNVQTCYRWSKKVMFKLSGRVSARARDISVYVKIKQPSGQGSQPLLEGFQIEQLGRTTVEVTGLGPVSWLLEKIATLATNLMRRRLAERLTGPVRAIIEENLNLPVT